MAKENSNLKLINATMMSSAARPAGTRGVHTRPPAGPPPRHRREGERELEPEADKRHDDEQRRHDGLQRLVPNLLPERRADGRRAHLRPARLGEGLLDPPAPAPDPPR